MYSKGQIVRIKCVNVLTYDEVEITPCEKLNLIIGANGSGKSTLISAIILGLGGNPAIVGRATELQKYVKNGKKNALIEIELYSPDGNDVVVRQYNVKNQSRFKLNGREIQIDKVHKLMRKYNIQINNLCQILPQEKLEEFAKMNDHERLEGTIKTVGNQNLADWLSELKESGTKQITENKKLENLRQQLAETVKKKNAMNVEARNIKEKEFLLEILKLLKQRHAWQYYYHLKDTLTKVDMALANKKEVCKNMVHVLKQCKSNLLNLSQDVRGQNEQIGRVNNELLELMKDVKKRQNDITAMSDQISDIKGEFKRKMKQFKTQESDESQLKGTIEQLKQQICNVTELSGQLDHMTRQIEEQKRKVRGIADTKSEIEYQMGLRSQELNAVENQLSKLSDVADYKMKLLERTYRDAYQGVQWVNENRSRFRGQVYGPMFLHLTVDDVNNAKYVENCISNRDLIAFMCEYKEDTTTLLVELNERKHLKINVVSAINRDRRSLTPRYPIERLQRLGFHSYVLDFLRGPDMIVTYLAATYNLHNIPVGTDYTYKVAEKIPDDIRVFFTDKLRMSVAIASITKLPIQSSSEISDARLLKVNVNRNDSEELQVRKEQLLTQLQEIKEKYETFNKNVASGDQALNVLQNEYRKLKAQHSGQGRLRETLKVKTRELQRLQNNVIDLNAEKKKCTLKVQLELSKVCNKFIELSEHFNRLIDCYARLQIEKINKEQCEKIYQKNLQITAEFVSAIKQEASSLRKLELKKRKMMKYANITHQWALKTTSGIDPYTRQFKKKKYFQRLHSSVIALHRMINKFQAKINCMGRSNDGMQILLDFRRFTREADSLKKRIERKEEEGRNYFEHIAQVKNNWITEVESLISTINENFSRFFANMNCAGEVSFYNGETGEDYDKYGIHIRVKFREEGNLQVLNAQTQSGGERAVSVAIYLLSLQELTSVPFRCIDEINQGMDANNERRIFDLLTKATEDQCNTQYFLLTPKLLPDLVFTPSMEILCPFNGVGSISHADLPIQYARSSISCSRQSQKRTRSPSSSSQASSCRSRTRSPSPQPSTSSQIY